MAEGLFRTEVHAGRSEQGLGGVWPGSSGAPTLFTLLLVTTVIIALVYLCTATHARSVSAYGFLFAEQGAARVRFDSGSGVVLAVHVSVGSEVSAGDPLMTLGSSVALGGAERGDSDVRSFTQRLREGFEGRLEQIEVQRLGIEEKHQLSRDQLNLEQEHLVSEMGRLQASRVLREERLQLVQAKVESLEPLHERRIISDLDWMDHQSLLLGLREELLSLDGQISVARKRRESDMIRLAEIDAVHEEARSQNAARRVELRMEHDSARVGGHRVLLAPKAGLVEALDAYPGMLVHSGMPLLDIVSPASELRAKLLVPGRAAGFVEPGLVVHLRFDAFPHQHFGTQSAHLLNLSRTVTAAGEVIGSYRVDESVYVGEARLSQQSVVSAQGNGRLREGMRFVADLQLEQRTLMQWLLEPLLLARGD